MRLLVYRLSLEIIFMRAGTLSTLFTAVPFACQVEGPKYTYKMNEWMNEWINPPNYELQEPTLFSAVTGVASTPDTRDSGHFTPLSCSWPALGAACLSGYLLSWLDCMLTAHHRLGQTVRGEVRAAHLYLAGRFDRDMEGPWKPFWHGSLTEGWSCASVSNR